MMKNSKKPDLPYLNAGNFSVWLQEFTGTLEGKNSGIVPCGECVGCCTSSYFIHIRPTDTDAMKHIPKEIMFHAPGLPKGNFLLGYDEKGHCPMFNNRKCSIYSYRPETCRQYDCRVYSATGLVMDEEKPRIAEQAMRWKFDISSSRDTEAFQAVQMAAEFISKHQSSFPSGYIPRNPPQLAVLAIRIHKIFIGLNSETIGSQVQELIDSILSEYGNGA